jgi:hypothetical protein
MQPEPGKALVYVIEVFQRPPGELGTPTIRVGLNGILCAAAHNDPYVQKVDMCGECPKSPIVNARAWLDSA